MLRKYFVKRARWNFLIMIVPTLLIFIFIGLFFVHSQREDIKKDSVRSLQSFEDSLEASIFNMGYQLDALMSNTSFSLALRNLVDNPEMRQNDQIAFRMLKYFFHSYETSYSYIHSIYLYLDDRDRFLTSDPGQIANIATYYDQEWYGTYQSMDPGERVYTNQRWVQRYTYGEPTEIISIFYRMTYMDGVIVINVDKGEYGKLLRSVLLSRHQKVMLFNSKGDVVCLTDPELEQFESDAFADSIRDGILTGMEEALKERWVNLQGEHYYVNILYSGYLNLYEVSMTSGEQLLDNVRFFLLMACLILLAEMGIMFFLAYTYTKRTFSYIEECVDIFSAAERGEALDSHFRDSNDEYALILNNVIRLYLSNSRIQMDLMEKQHENEMTEMRALQLQINPHFIFNTMQTLDFEAIKQLGIHSELHEMIQQLALVVKYALSEPMETVTLRMELEYLRAYLQIQNVRFNNNVITYFDVDDSVLDQKVFRLLLQPVLENCFEHGIEPGQEKILTKIKIFDRGDTIYFAVVDNGVGISKEDIQKLYERINSHTARNIGLTNLNRRLILHYGPEYGLRIRSKLGLGTEISFVIPKVDPKTVTEIKNDTKN
ncbi:MAG: histidine kinase [Lachnospiraceae bacterium]|nr:histidine kinase [Lachnospiraceae bacterium]